jgi:hypothetical protein
LCVRGRGVCDNLFFMRGFAFFGAVPSSLHPSISYSNNNNTVLIQIFQFI